MLMKCTHTGGHCSRPECIRVNKCKYYQTKEEYDPAYANSNPPYETISFGAGLVIDVADKSYEGGGGSYGGGGSSSSWSDSSSDSSDSSSDSSSSSGD